MKPIRISIHALGGQGGGVLSDWLVQMAQAEGWGAQATSVPGVAQRTGSTVYYVELAPPGREPVMALMPTPGDVDLVLAAELMEAGRALARGLVTPDRTTLIASSHRVFAIAEKSALGDGVVSPARVLEAAQAGAKRLILLDLAAIAERHGAVISAPLFGAVAGSGALPFARDAFEGAIRVGGKGVKISLAAFGDAYEQAQPSPSPVQGEGQARSASQGEGVFNSNQTLTLPLGSRRAGPSLSPGGERGLPDAALPVAQLGVERLLDYQSGAYADLYLTRLHAVAAADRELGGERHDFALTQAAARHLALWMAFEDAIRVADLKTRPARSARVAAEAKLRGDQIAHVTEFMHPRFEEIADMAPARWGERLLGSARARRWAERLVGRGRFVTTTRASGFLLLWSLARLRRYRPRTLRYREEQGRIAAWLESAVNAARTDYRLGVEVIRLQRLVKGYGDTHARGLANMSTIMTLLPRLIEAGGPADKLRTLHKAALADDEGRALGRAIRALERSTGLAIGAPVIVHAKE